MQKITMEMIIINMQWKKINMQAKNLALLGTKFGAKQG